MNLEHVELSLFQKLLLKSIRMPGLLAILCAASLLPGCDDDSDPAKGAVPFSFEDIGTELIFHGDTYDLTVDKTSLALSVNAGPETVLSTIDDGKGLVLRDGGLIASPVRIVSYRTTGNCRYALPLADCLQATVKLDDEKTATLEIYPAADYAQVVFFLDDNSSWQEVGPAFALADNVHWYGGGTLIPEKNYYDQLYFDGRQDWPLETGSHERAPLMTDEGTNVITSFWFNSLGAGIFFPDYYYRHVRFNLPEEPGVFSVRTMTVPWRTTEVYEPESRFYIIVKENPREVYRRFLTLLPRGPGHQPDGSASALVDAPLPRSDMFDNPVWTTWAAYKWEINQNRVFTFADSILAHGFAAGIIEIDDKWTPEWGQLVFDTEKFPDPATMVDYLHGRDLKVSLWVPPFVVSGTDNFAEGDEGQYFLRYLDEESGEEKTRLVGWWNTGFVLENSGMIDFGNPDAAAWFGGKVQALVDDYGIDGYKYDAGEAAFFPPDAIGQGGITAANYCDYYLQWAQQYHYYEIRSAHFGQYLLPVVRQFDKDSTWGSDNGLYSVVTGALALGVIGYPLVLPDMIGGNAYTEWPDDELFIRWTQANAYLPLMQFSILPWDENFGAEVETISRDYVNIHQGLVPLIRTLVEEAADNGDPLVRPLFWHYPDEESAYTISDQFLLGDSLLVAPVLEAGVVARDVWLPPGQWRDLADDEVYEGPQELTAHPAPLERIPVFEKVQ